MSIQKESIDCLIGSGGGGARAATVVRVVSPLLTGVFSGAWMLLSGHATASLTTMMLRLGASRCLFVDKAPVSTRPAVSRTRSTTRPPTDHRHTGIHGHLLIDDVTTTYVTLPA